MAFPEFFFLNYWFHSLHTWHLPLGCEFLAPIHFRVPSLIFGPLVAKYLAENGVSGTFWKTIGSIHFIPGIYPYGVSLLTPIHCLVLSLIFGPLVAKYLVENRVSETFFKKTIGSINYIPGIYPYGWVCWWLIIFMFLASFLALWWPYLSEIGVSEIFL